MSSLYSESDQERWAFEPPKSKSRTEFERDRARVLHSSALRRLGAKTQVLGPEADDFVRTRLTHSLEVAQIGRSLAKNLGCDPDIVETACLCHDLGHPPFGHNGERALNEVAASAGGFEGNAQTLRILTRLEPKRFHSDGAPAGLNLTRATLDATVKYPWRRGQGPNGPQAPKFGVYDDDALVFEWLHGNHGTAKPIEAQIMDLADDIAYCVHDVEDSLVHTVTHPRVAAWLGATQGPEEILRTVGAERDAVIAVTQQWYGVGVSMQELEAAFERLLAMPSWPGAFSGSMRDLARLKDLTSDLIGRFVKAITSATRARYGAEPLWRYRGGVVIPEATLAEITALKGLAVYFVMAPREQEPIYFEQRTIVFDLVDAISEQPEQRLEPVLIDAWRDAANSSERLRVVIDQVASLTDLSARAWHARYCGMLRN
ncbi:MAG: deoxyguanosinetriphosphate triphosphohydrolase [Arcanobacterium sp.]|nr:deoxyguanosinetriphosphate triphosphohydrolase [Arcanobacterium sp.]